MQIKKKFDEAEKAYYEKFGELIPILYGYDPEDIYTEEFITKIYSSIQSGDSEEILKEYPLSDVDY